MLMSFICLYLHLKIKYRQSTVINTTVPATTTCQNSYLIIWKAFICCQIVYTEYCGPELEIPAQPSRKRTAQEYAKRDVHFRIPRCNCHFETHKNQSTRIHGIFKHWGSVYMLIKGAMRPCYFDSQKSTYYLEGVWALLSSSLLCYWDVSLISRHLVMVS